MSEWAWLTLFALGTQVLSGAVATPSSENMLLMPFSSLESVLVAQTVPATTLITLKSCDMARMKPDCTSSGDTVITSITPTSMPVPQQSGMMEQTALLLPCNMQAFSPTPTAILDVGSGSGMDHGVVPSPTLTPLPSTLILITFPGLSTQGYIAIQQNITTAFKQALASANLTTVFIVDKERSNAITTVVLLYLETTAAVADDQATSEAFYQLNNIMDKLTRQLNITFCLQLQVPISTTLSPPSPIDLAWWNWLIIGISGAIAFSACILLNFACYWRYLGFHRKKKKEEKEHLLDGEEPDGEAVELGKIQEREQRIKKVSRISFRSRAEVRSHPLTVDELRRSLMNPATIYAEYDTIPSNMVTMAEVPPGAEEKNRYKDVLPNAPTRVALFLKFGVANSDYINANFIRGYHNTAKAYIATQGPMYWTAADFWRMVWEQRSSSIIMVTSLEERGMVKCARYWPDTSVSHSTVYEDLEVIVRRRTPTMDYTTTNFLLRHREKMVSREVTHFWFTSWPDHGVPLTTQPVLNFILHARKQMRDLPGPTVVHCSAGIGRTGVFIGADIGMQQLEETGEVDVLRIVSTMRQDRGGMVQTRDQYLFLHQVLLDYSHNLDRLRSPYHHQGRLQTTQEEEEEVEEEGGEEEYESGIRSGDSQTALT